MKPSLFGQETEYAITGRRVRTWQGTRRAVPPEALLPLYMQAAKAELTWMQDARTGDGLYTPSGARLYGEIAGHPEFCTPECPTPAALAAQDMAGERILGRLAASVAKQHRIQTSALKRNTGFVISDNATYAMHESYTVWTDDIESAVDPLSSHLVTRIMYAGAGYLSDRDGCDGFELSQRARHIKTAVAADTTGHRPVFCTRIRKASDCGHSELGPWVRMHQICADGKRCPFGTYLTFGTTGVILHLLSHGIRVGNRLAIKDPVRAMQTISLDPTLQAKVQLVDRRRLTAIEIQTCYIEECNRALRGIESPDWVGPVMHHWQHTIDALACDPIRLADRLDIYLLQMILSHQIKRAGYTWSEISAAQKLLVGFHRTVPDPIILAVIADDDANLSAEAQVLFREVMGQVKAAGPRTPDLLRFLVRLKALEVSFREIGGLVDQLRESGKINDVILMESDIQHAMDEPPAAVGRAALRGQLVKENHGDPGWVCDWHFVGNPRTSVWYHFGDPFAITANRGKSAPNDRPPAF